MHIAVHGADAFLYIVAFILFAAATSAAFFAPGHRLVLVLVSAGLALVTLAHVIS